MTDKQMLFCEEYLANGCSAIEAYMKVYPKTKSRVIASNNANRLLSRKDVKDFIEEKLKEIESEKIAQAAEILAYFSSVMRGEMKDELLTMDGDLVKVDAPTRDRTKAAELLGKALGIFEKNINLKVEVPVFVGEDELKE